MPYRPAQKIFRGCLVINSANQASGTLFWDTEIYDTDNIHPANSSELIVPAGIFKIKLFAQASFANLSNNGYIAIQINKNGILLTAPSIETDEHTGNDGTTPYTLSLSSPVLTCVPTDFYELIAFGNIAQTLLSAKTYFGMELIY